MFLVSFDLLLNAGLVLLVAYVAYGKVMPAVRAALAAPLAGLKMPAFRWPSFNQLLGVGLLLLIAFTLYDKVVPPTPNAELVSIPPADYSGPFQEVSVVASGYGGYLPATVTVKEGIPVRFKFTAEPGAGCGREVEFPEFGFRGVAPETFVFTPIKTGTYRFACSMNMFRGRIIVT